MSVTGERKSIRDLVEPILTVFFTGVLVLVALVEIWQYRDFILFFLYLISPVIFFVLKIIGCFVLLLGLYWLIKALFPY